MRNHDLTEAFAHLSGKPVLDQEGLPLGTVRDLYLDDDSGKPSFITLSGELGGARAVPAHALSEEELRGDSLRLPYGRAFIEGAPTVTEEHISEEEQAALLAYYREGQEATPGEAYDHDGETLTSTGTRGDDLRQAEDDHLRERGEDHTEAARPSVTLHEEVAHVSTQENEAASERVRLRKHVRTEEEAVTVPVTHEEVVVERRPLEGQEAPPARFGSTEEVEVRLREEVPVVDKRVVAKEEVSLTKDRSTKEVEVPVALRKEEVTVEREGFTDAGDTTSASGEERPLKSGNKDFLEEDGNPRHESLGDKLRGVFSRDEDRRP